MRLTRPRLAIAALLFDGENKHMTVGEVHAAIPGDRHSVALATAYNVLNEFAARGLLRRVIIDSKSFRFDTNLQPHDHSYDVDTGKLSDIPKVTIKMMPNPPQDYRVSGIDVIVRVGQPKPA